MEGIGCCAFREKFVLIRRYGRENSIKPELYHHTIKKALGFAENDGRFHSSDPRHWIKGHVPNQAKLEMYDQFIMKVYPEFKFSESRRNNYISIGESLWRFSTEENALSEAKLKAQAKTLHRKFFKSEIYQPVRFWGDTCMGSLMTFRAIDDTPFLLAYKFNYQYLPGHESTKDTDHKYDVILEVGGLEIVSVHKGVICPQKNGEGYHGILHTSHNEPNHIRLMKRLHSKGLVRGFEYKGNGGTWWDSTSSVPFQPCGYMAKLDQAVSDMGEPML